jgi:hypothetical protein
MVQLAWKIEYESEQVNSSLTFIFVKVNAK